eukprot:m.10502 g.10502  ORF g.10502 m.10502 type:complete len:439 (+) comp22380_c0_seq2:111-1427(+)
MTGIPPLTPAGLDAIHSACKKVYPDQPNPLQVTALVKFWLGGPDPLDYISMYSTPGSPEQGIPPHWHYISFGLSDLHGDGRVHEVVGHDGPSGFGFELTLRLKREEGDSSPPTWPAELMQGLARYVFSTGNTLCPGDHVSWHTPLDNGDSRIQHMLMAEDAQLAPVSSYSGITHFVQILGICQEELKAAQQWNGRGMLELLRKNAICGGPWLVTDMRRGESVFELDPTFQDAVDEGISREGSDLTGVSSICSWEDANGVVGVNDLLVDPLFMQLTHITPSGLTAIPELRSPVAAQVPRASDTSHENAVPSPGLDTPAELMRTRTLDFVHLKFTIEAGSLLPLALKGRLLHGRHFTYKSSADDLAITFVCEGIAGAIADAEHPYAAHGPWLQVFISRDFVPFMLETMRDLGHPDELMSNLPKEYRFEEKKLLVTITVEE